MLRPARLESGRDGKDGGPGSGGNPGGGSPGGGAGSGAGGGADAHASLLLGALQDEMERLRAGIAREIQEEVGAVLAFVSVVG